MKAEPKALLHDFKFVGDELYCEKVPVRSILDQVGTPAFIYSYKTLAEHLEKLNKAFGPADPLICYSMKANSNLAVLRALLDKGAGLDIVSGGELFRAKQVGCDPQKIVFAGVGKSDEEIAEAIRYGILFFNVESEAELMRIHEVAKGLERTAQVSLRVNPAVDPKTHDHIATGKAESKFGMDLETARRIIAHKSQYASIRVCALHVHIGSQIVSGDPFVEAFRKVLGFVDEIEKDGVKIEYLNLGGGLGVIYDNETPQTAEEFAAKILPLFKGRKFRLVFEPGRFIAANAGILGGKVLYVKQTQVKNFAICDTAMNDLIRPTLYDAYHEVVPVSRRPEAEKWIYDVVGPVCESGDVLAKERQLQELRKDDYLAFLSAGAYGFVMASNYNSRVRPCEVMVSGDQFAVIRKRETYHSLIEGEVIPPFLAEHAK